MICVLALLPYSLKGLHLDYHAFNTWVDRKGINYGYGLQNKHMATTWKCACEVNEDYKKT